MPLVPAICTQCGAQIEVDNTHEAGICKHCGTAFITEKAINNYTTNITNNNNFTGANINMSIVTELEQLISAAEGFQQLGEYYKAQETYKKIVEKYPQDVRGWIGCMNNYDDCEFLKEEPSYWNASWLENTDFSRCYKNACILADKDTKNKLEQRKKAYIDAIDKKWSDFKTNISLISLNKFIGNDIYYHSDLDDNDYYDEDAYVTYEHQMYVLENRLYFQITYLKAFITFEINSIDNDGNINMEFVKAGSENADESVRTWLKREKKLQLKIYHYAYEKDKKYIKLYLDGKLIELKPNKWAKIYDSQNKEQGCYIATCVYGSYDCPQVWTLRRFRDYTLDETWYGRAFIKCYYSISPTLVKWFGNQKWFRTFWKNRLDSMISNLNLKGVDNTQYHDKY